MYFFCINKIFLCNVLLVVLYIFYLTVIEHHYFSLKNSVLFSYLNFQYTINW